MSAEMRVGRYPDEMSERAVRLVFERLHEYPSQWKANESIARKLGVNHETLRMWVRKAEVDGGQRPGVTTEDRVKIKDPETVTQ